MTSAPRVSVLMPVFNTVSYIDEAIESIRLQTFTDFELVVIDDGSDDGSSECLLTLAAAEPRIRLLIRENRGLIATRNELLNLARCDLVAWMDSDDLSHPKRLELQVAAFSSDDQLVCIGGAAQRVDPEGYLLDIEQYPTCHEDIIQGQLTGGAMRFAATMMRRDVALRVGGFREPFRIGEDFDLLLRMSEVGRMTNLSSAIYSYRQHAASTFSGLSSQWLNYRRVILSLAKERSELGSDCLQRGETLVIEPTNQFSTASLIADAYTEWARQALKSGRFNHAFNYAKAALRAQPFSPPVWKLLIVSSLQAWRASRS